MTKPASTRQYWRVAPGFWGDEKVTGAEGGEPWTDDMKLLWLYLLTCEHRTAEGLFRLPKGYIEDDLNWGSERLAEPFGRLLAEGFIEYDGRARLILIINALDYQAPENPNQVKAAIRMLQELPKSPLFMRLVELADIYSPPFAEALRERLPERLPEGYAKPPAPAPSPTPGGIARAREEAPLDDPKETKDGKTEVDPVATLAEVWRTAHKDLGRSAPTQRQTEVFEAIVSEKLNGGASPDVLKEAIRRLVGKGKPPSVLPAFVSEVEVERPAPSKPRPYVPPEPPLTPEEREAAIAAAAEGAKLVRAACRDAAKQRLGELASGIGATI